MSKLLKQGLEKKTELLIHLVGSGSEESTFPFKYEELLHYLPNLKKLEIVLVGPESSTKKILLSESDLCETCMKKDVIVRSICMEYEKMQFDDDDKNPDLVMCCNSGVHYDSGELKFIESNTDDDVMNTSKSLSTSWKPALQRMLRLKTLLVFTSYNDWEIGKDKMCLKNLGAQVLIPPQLNPYRSLHLKMDPWRPHSSYTTNHFFFACIGV